MFTRAVRLTRLRGVDVHLDVSLLPFAALVAWFFAVRFRQDNSLGVALAMALVGGLLFFASILAHELAHALEARHRGLDVQRITLFLFGGVTEMHATSQRPRDEFVVAAVGPWISLVCGAAFGLLATFASWLLPADLAAPVAEVAGLLAWVNVFLAVFNLVPGAPLDGGRVLRAGLWWLLKDRRRALRISARAGQVLAAVLVVLGIRAVQIAGFSGLLGGAMWLVVGVFVWYAAQAEIRQNDVDAVLDGRRAADLVVPLPVAVSPGQPLDLVSLGAGAQAHALLPVVDGDRFVGVVAVRELVGLRADERATQAVRDLLREVDHLPQVGIDEDVRNLIAAFSGKTDAVRIHDGTGRDLAVVTEREVARSLRALRRNGGRAAAQPAPEAAT